ncbi:MAG: hypothetical protein EOM20_11420 [Spartobacteria bacterium]|nr:hypothetical protein [Spartobacteria bacterium]
MYVTQKISAGFAVGHRAGIRIAALKVGEELLHTVFIGDGGVSAVSAGRSACHRSFCRHWNRVSAVGVASAFPIHVDAHVRPCRCAHSKSIVDFVVGHWIVDRANRLRKGDSADERQGEYKQGACPAMTYFS